MKKEKQLELLTATAYLKQKEVAAIVGASAQSVGRELKKHDIRRTCFGYLTTDVIKVLGLDDYIEILRSAT